MSQDLQRLVLASMGERHKLNMDIKDTIVPGEVIFMFLRRYFCTLLGTMVCSVLFPECSNLIVLPDCTMTIL